MYMGTYIQPRCFQSGFLFTSDTCVRKSNTKHKMHVTIWVWSRNKHGSTCTPVDCMNKPGSTRKPVDCSPLFLVSSFKVLIEIKRIEFTSSHSSSYVRSSSFLLQLSFSSVRSPSPPQYLQGPLTVWTLQWLLLPAFQRHLCILPQGIE